MLKRIRSYTIAALAACVLTAAPASLRPLHVVAQSNCHSFTETGKNLCGRFLQYWQAHGGLPQQGFPLTNTFSEVSTIDGRTYTVQYFERAVFEHHPENQPPNDVLLSLLGAMRLRDKYGDAGPPNQLTNTEVGSRLVSQTGKRIGGRFLRYWDTHGSLAQQGYPISDEFDEVSEIDGQSYRVQYFERAVFEYHPAEPLAAQILLSLLGVDRFQRNYTAGSALPEVPPPAAVAGQGQAPGQPPAASKPPSDPSAFANYLSEKYNHLGEQTLGFRSVLGLSTSNLKSVTLSVDTPTWEYLSYQASGTRGREWGKAVLAEARKAWPSGDFVISLQADGYTFDPCWRCESDCYYIDHDVDLDRGWFYAYDFVTIIRTSRSGEVVNICNFDNP
jgi:hypothetical protein